MYYPVECLECPFFNCCELIAEFMRQFGLPQMTTIDVVIIEAVLKDGQIEPTGVSSMLLEIPVVPLFPSPFVEVIEMKEVDGGFSPTGKTGFVIINLGR